ncbi:MAG: molybdopterin-dependent oxidoreductase [Acidobacteriia bacterium]|nr:molybdopterin-dependent oxidoreductase [Terriglobia bacterium]
MSTVPTTCPFCACGCGFYLLANKGELVGVAPSETHPVSLGRLCARGWGAHEAALWGDRLRQPLINRHGNLETASWVEALDDVTRRFRDLIAAGKSVGVLGSPRASNEENYLAGKLARAGFQTNNVDFCFHSICRPLFAGLEDVCGDYAPSISLNDIEASETILLIEGDLAQTHPRAAFSVMKAVEAGAHLVTIGYSRTQMARLSSLHLQTTPGNEGEVIDGLLAAVLRPGGGDRTSLAIPCEGYDALLRNVEAVKITEEMRQAADWIAHATRATFLMAPTSGYGDQTRNAAAALATLAAVTGHLDRPDSGLLPLLARSNVRGACDMGVAPDRLPGHQPLCDQRAQQRLQDLWGKKLPSTRGLEAESLLQSVSGLIVLADDPSAVLPMGGRALAALGKIEFLVVLDAFVTPPSRIAHAVLPIACFAETEGTLTNMEGRVQSLQVATQPPGEARPGWQVLAELCARFDAGVSYNSTTDVLREIAQAAPRYARMEQRASDDEWGGRWVKDPDRGKFKLYATGAAALTSAERPHVLVRDGAFDWGRDPLVSFSPTLSRDSQSQQKLFPNGFVEICKQDADGLGVPVGRQVKLTSVHGNAVVPIRLRADLKPGVLLVPYAFRDHVANVLGTDSVTAVKVEQA